MLKGKPSFSITTILILCWLSRIKAQYSSSCVSSSCGEISISYPFRLATDPPNCGHPDPIFKLQCLQNRTILQSGSGKYVVHSISYNNFSIRISDLGIDKNNYSSCPAYDSIGLWSTIFSLNSPITEMIFVNCLKPVSNAFYVEDPVCGNQTAFSNSSRVYSYVVVGWVYETAESCSKNRRSTLVSSDVLEVSSNYTMIHDAMAYGVEFTWFRALCGDCNRSKGSCSLENNKIRCHHYCKEDTPFSELTFRCKLDYYGVLISVVGVGIGSLLGLRFILAVLFVIGLLLYRRRKQRSSTDKSVAMEHGLDQESSSLELGKR